MIPLNRVDYSNQTERRLKKRVMSVVWVESSNKRFAHTIPSGRSNLKEQVETGAVQRNSRLGSGFHGGGRLSREIWGEFSPNCGSGLIVCCSLIRSSLIEILSKMLRPFKNSLFQIDEQTIEIYT
jgi:hypothetical protein